MFGRLKEQPPPQSLVGATTAPTDAADERRGPREGLIVLAFTIVTVALTALVIARSERDAVHDPAQKAARGEINGLDGQSMLREANLRQALAKVEAGPRKLIANIRVSATSVDVQVRDEDGNRRLLNIDPGFDVDENDFGVGDDDAVRAEAINPGAPERMVRAVAERTGLGFDAVDYVSMSFSGTGERSWYMSLKEGPARERQWLAAADGTDLRKPGELSQAQKDENERRQRQFEREQQRYKRLSAKRDACLRKARDAATASRCLERFQP